MTDYNILRMIESTNFVFIRLLVRHMSANLNNDIQYTMIGYNDGTNRKQKLMQIHPKLFLKCKYIWLGSSYELTIFED